MDMYRQTARTKLFTVGLAALLLLLAGLGCSVCPLVPRPATDTPMPPADTPLSEAAPTATPVSTSPPPSSPTPALDLLTGMAEYTNPVAGFSLLYPDSWVYQEVANGVLFAEDEEMLDISDPTQGPLGIVFAGSLEDMGEEVRSPQELLDSLWDDLCEADCEVVERESRSFGEAPGEWMEASWTDPMADRRVHGYLVAAVGGEVGGGGFGFWGAPADVWDEYGPVLWDVVASLEFHLPEIPDPVKRGPLQPGQVEEGTLTFGVRDVWSFEAQAGAYVTIRLEAADADELDTYLELYDGEGSLIAEDDDGGGGTDSLIADFSIPEAGTYYIHVLPYSGAGEYRLGLDISAEPTSGGVIEYGALVEGRLPGNGEHTWEFEGQQGDEIRIAMRAVSGDVDSYLQLYSPDDELLIYDDDSGEDFDALIEYYVLPANGTYRIEVSDISGEPGEYELTLEQAQLEVQGDLTFEQSAGGTLEPGARHHWLFDGEQGDFVTLSMIALDEGVDPYLELFGPNGEKLMTDDDSGDGSNAAILEFELPLTGVYRLVARSYDNTEAGEYALTMERIQLEIAGTLSYGDVVTETLEPGARHHWLFEGEQGDIVTISIVALSEDMDTYLELFAPNSELVMLDDDSGGDANAAILQFRLPLTGFYRVVARGFSDTEAGPYQLSLVETGK